MSAVEDFDQLTHSQRLKAAVHHTTMKICTGSCEDKNINLNKMVVAAISETIWKKCEQIAIDLEAFSKHGKRTTINADDVKLLVRKSPGLLEYISNIHEESTANKAETKKKGKKGKNKDRTAATSVTETMDVDEDSRS